MYGIFVGGGWVVGGGGGGRGGYLGGFILKMLYHTEDLSYVSHRCNSATGPLSESQVAKTMIKQGI
jgi:hypothetical protein